MATTYKTLSIFTLLQVRSRGLPDDFEGSSVRVVEIEGLDSNMCCGTHVTSLSHLQVRRHAHLVGGVASHCVCAVVCEAFVL